MLAVTRSRRRLSVGIPQFRLSRRKKIRQWAGGRTSVANCVAAGCGGGSAAWKPGLGCGTRTRPECGSVGGGRCSTARSARRSGVEPGPPAWEAAPPCLLRLGTAVSDPIRPSQPRAPRTNTPPNDKYDGNRRHPLLRGGGRGSSSSPNGPTSAHSESQLTPHTSRTGRVGHRQQHQMLGLNLQATPGPSSPNSVTASVRRSLPEAALATGWNSDFILPACCGPR